MIELRRPDEAQSIGQMQKKLEAAHEHISHVWGALCRLHPEIRRDMFNPPSTHGRKPGTVDYHLAAVHQYLIEALWGSYKFAGGTDGQLCPYKDCCYDLAFGGEGWFMCPNCKRPFRTREADSDIEDYHTRRKNDDDVLPDNIPEAKSLGPSWATPEEEKS